MQIPWISIPSSLLTLTITVPSGSFAELLDGLSPPHDAIANDKSIRKKIRNFFIL